MAGNPLNFVQTAVSLASSVASLVVGRNTNRLYLLLQCTSSNPCTISFSSSPVVGAGLGLDGASATGGQGGSVEFVACVPIGPVYAISNAASSIVAISGS